MHVASASGYVGERDVGIVQGDVDGEPGRHSASTSITRVGSRTVTKVLGVLGVLSVLSVC